MPTVKQIQNAKKKLKMTPKSKGNKPRIPNRLTYILISVDPKIARDRQFLKRVQEFAKKA
jgi:hypothetical protein